MSQRIESASKSIFVCFRYGAFNLLTESLTAMSFLSSLCLLLNFSVVTDVIFWNSSGRSI